MLDREFVWKCVDDAMVMHPLVSAAKVCIARCVMPIWAPPPKRKKMQASAVIA